jgi:adenylate kinase
MLKKCRIVFLGPPGAGKGTIAKELSLRTSIVHISTGDLFRSEIRNNTVLGLQAKGYIEEGKLVPDDLVADIVNHRLLCSDCNDGFFLDGFPRTLPQSKLLESKLNDISKPLDFVILLNAGKDLIFKRLTARLMCRSCGASYNKIYLPSKVEGICDLCGGELYQRKDDSLETAKERLEVYEQQTAPLIDFYRKKDILLEVDSDRDRDDIIVDIIKELK